MICRSCGANMFVPDRCDACGAAPAKLARVNLRSALASEDEPTHPTSSTTWITLTWVLVAAMAVDLALAVYRLVVIFQVLDFYESWNGAAASLDKSEMLRLADVELTSVNLVAFSAIGYLILFMVWIRSLRRTVAHAGSSPKEVTKHWAYIAWRVGVFASLIFVLTTTTTKMPTGTLANLRDGIIAIEQHQAIYGWVRIALVAVLGIAVVALYRRVRTLTAAA